ncbi:MAG: MBL fold metallo-hydrolase [Lentisphaeria bacterium]|nr:MBL fold metallo-hydrolase [Lentisphaeria bacterium]
MKIETLPAGLLETNCYLVTDDASRTLYVIDPGGDAEKLVSAAEKYTFERCVILLTHYHIDHVAAAGTAARELKAETVFLRKEDQPYYYSPENHLLPYVPPASDLPQVTDVLPEGCCFTLLELPGHTPGGAGFYCAAEKVLFAGDTIFASSIGRTDFPGGDYDTLINSIRQEIFSLPDEVTIYPGHGGATTVGAERVSNPYLS